MIKIKPLKWQKTTEDSNFYGYDWGALTPLGHYYIEEPGYKPKFVLYFNQLGMSIEGEFDSLMDAREAASDDYKKRIMSALEIEL